MMEKMEDSRSGTLQQQKSIVQGVKVTIPINTLLLITAMLPLVAFVACVLISLVYHFEGSTATHCQVTNLLPSISAAIGDFTPQRYIWRICIALHITPRLVGGFVFRANFLRYSKQNGQFYKILCEVNSLAYAIELASLVLLSYVSSSENYGVHEKSFIMFVIVSQIYMSTTLYLSVWCTWSISNRTVTQNISAKKRLWFVNVTALILSGLLYLRHIHYCEPYVFTLFSLCEYIIVVSNIWFHRKMGADYRHHLIDFYPQNYYTLPQ